MKEQSQSGFSLLELLVALFVVVIITSLVALGVNSGARDIDLEAKVKSLADISGYAIDEAQMRGVDMGLLIERVDDGGDEVYRYGWRERMPQGWLRPVVDAEIFLDQYFPAEIEVELELESSVFEDLDIDDSEVDRRNADPAPQIIFYSSGEVTAGALNLRQIDTSELLWRLEWDLLGRFKLMRRGEESTDESDKQ